MAPLITPRMLSKLDASLKRRKTRSARSALSTSLIRRPATVAKSSKMEALTMKKSSTLKPIERYLRRPIWSEALESAALEAASLSTRGSGWAPSGLASAQDVPSRPELPGVP